MRGDDSNTMLYVLIALSALSIAGAVAVLRRAGGGSFPWIQFYTKGKESGFNLREINLLRRVAVENKLENPTSLFWSIRQLDRSIKGVIVKFRSEGHDQEAPQAQLIAKLFDFRKKVEFDLPRWKLGLKSTRKLPARQRITVTLPGIGTYKSQIVENLRRYMAISYPEGPVLPPDFTWDGQKLNAYFWRVDDAGYVFETKVLGDFREQDYPILHIAHSDSLIRSQKRRSIREEVNKPAKLFPIAKLEAANDEIETRSGLRCRILDVSEDGAAILVGGRAKVGLAVKIQFTLTDEPIVMLGVVKGITFKQNKNQSILHIQANIVPARTRNKILSYVYNIFGERKQYSGSPVCVR
jgi:c-di-GMP-binding flagellar brake protein YcgR